MSISILKKKSVQGFSFMQKMSIWGQKVSEIQAKLLPKCKHVEIMWQGWGLGDVTYVS